MLASPEDDLPRLVYADWLEEEGEVERADFIRAQCDLARAEPWDPIAVQSRHQDRVRFDGKAWQKHLPPLDPRIAVWDQNHPFHRGFGYRVSVRQLSTFLEDAGPRIFAEEPIGELHLSTATRDDWMILARQPWLADLRTIRFFGLSTPIEPVRILCEQSTPLRLEEIIFEMASGWGFPEVMTGLFRAKLGQQLKRLTLWGGPDNVDDLAEVLFHCEPGPVLDSLNVRTIALTRNHAVSMAHSPRLTQLRELSLRNVPDGGTLLTWALAEAPWAGNLRILRAIAANIDHVTVDTIVDRCPQLRELDLGGNTLRSLPQLLVKPGALPELRVLRLNRCALNQPMIGELLASDVWQRLVEVDLQMNLFGEMGGRLLLEAPIPPNLEALVLDGYATSGRLSDELRERYGRRLQFRM